MQALIQYAPRITGLEIGSIVYDDIIQNEGSAPMHKFTYLVHGEEKGTSFFSLDGEQISTSVNSEYDFDKIRDEFAKAATARGIHTSL